MWSYKVICQEKVTDSCDNPRDAHYWARVRAKSSGFPAFVVKVVCKWEMQAVRENA